MSKKKRVVVKIGSSTLVNKSGALDERFLASLALQIATLREQDIEAIIVSSGAIAAGINSLSLPSRPEEMGQLQAVASVGSVALAHAYDRHFAIQDLKVGQVLLTKYDIASEESYRLAHDTFEHLLTFEVVPIVNENDTVAVDEIKFGDNDTLAALVGVMLEADLVILLSDIDGLYDSDPNINGEACLVPRIDLIDDAMLKAAGGSGSLYGSGGMATKLLAARTLMDAGISMVICDGHRKDVILDIIQGHKVGTIFTCNAQV